MLKSDKSKRFRDWFGRDTGCIVLGEIGVNHNGDVGLARKLIDLAVEAGADAVKFQTFRAEALATRTASKADYQSRNDARNESQVAMLKRLEFTPDEWREVRDYCAEKGIVFVSTPFDDESASFLEELGVGGYKVGSGDLTNLPMLRHIAGFGKPMIISTGMATLAETEEAVEAIEGAGDPPLAILHCVSDYPAAPEEANLKAIDTLREAFGRPTGWSDHTLGDAISIAAIARGADMLEKHFTLDTGMEGPDHKASLDPEGFIDLISKIRMVESAIGDGRKRPAPSEAATAAIARRSVVAAKDLEAGATIAREDLVLKRPGTGLHPREIDRLVGMRLRNPVAADTLLSPGDIEPAG